jgi:hypothetical protein
MPGEKIDLYTWPPDAVLKVMKPGQAVPRKLLATATTNSSGHYELRVPVARLTAAAVTTGYVNLEIDSADGISFFTYQASSNPQSGGPSGLTTVNLGGRRSNGINCGHYPNGTACTFQGFQFQRHRAPAWAVVGQGYIVKQRNTRGDTVSFSYTQGSSHSQDSALGSGYRARASTRAIPPPAPTYPPPLMPRATGPSPATPGSARSSAPVSTGGCAPVSGQRRPRICHQVVAGVRAWGNPRHKGGRREG